MRSSLLALLAAATLLAACADGGSSGTTEAPSPTPSSADGFGIGTVVIDTDEGSALLTVEVADSDAQHRRGLMGREHLPEDEGMVFVFLEERTGGFWMKNTLIPLSIAFFDVDGKIVSILDMEPCTADPCPVYDPGVPYHGALEVNRGAFEDLGVEVGDTVTLTRSEG